MSQIIYLVTNYPINLMKRSWLEFIAPVTNAPRSKTAQDFTADEFLVLFQKIMAQQDFQLMVSFAEAMIYLRNNRVIINNGFQEIVKCSPVLFEVMVQADPNHKNFIQVISLKACCVYPNLRTIPGIDDPNATLFTLNDDYYKPLNINLQKKHYRLSIDLLPGKFFAERFNPKETGIALLDAALRSYVKHGQFTDTLPDYNSLVTALNQLEPAVKNNIVENVDFEVVPKSDWYAISKAIEKSNFIVNTAIAFFVFYVGASINFDSQQDAIILGLTFTVLFLSIKHKNDLSREKTKAREILSRFRTVQNDLRIIEPSVHMQETFNPTFFQGESALQQENYDNHDYHSRVRINTSLLT